MDYRLLFEGKQSGSFPSLSCYHAKQDDNKSVLKQFIHCGGWDPYCLAWPRYTGEYFSILKVLY